MVMNFLNFCCLRNSSLSIFQRQLCWVKYSWFITPLTCKFAEKFVKKSPGSNIKVFLLLFMRVSLWFLIARLCLGIVFFDLNMIGDLWSFYMCSWKFSVTISLETLLPLLSSYNVNLAPLDMPHKSCRFYSFFFSSN